jgi:hypothetical protein
MRRPKLFLGRLGRWLLKLLRHWWEARLKPMSWETDRGGKWADGDQTEETCRRILMHLHGVYIVYDYMYMYICIYIIYMCAPTEWAKFVHLWRRRSVASPRLTMRPSPAQRQSGTPQPRTNSCDRSSKERVENWRREDITWNPVLYIMLCQKRSHTLYYIMIYKYI